MTKLWDIDPDYVHCYGECGDYLPLNTVIDVCGWDKFFVIEWDNDEGAHP